MVRAMRFALATLALLAVARAVLADCPPCFPGGGPAATDCFVQWAGVSATATACADGSACDADGLLDGVCTFPVAACINVAPCAGPLSSIKASGRDASARTLDAALRALDPASQSCTPQGLAVALKAPGPKGVKPATAKITTVAASGGKRDRDALRFTCEPAVPSLARDVQPIFTAKCATPACHVGLPGQGQLNLEEGQSLGTLVGQAAFSPFAGKLQRVRAGSVKQSYLARKILGKGLKRGDPLMPQACGAPTTPCLTEAEKYLIVAWIQTGANP
jgi:hypothetical protein